MFCEKCGAQLSEGARFCSACGHQVGQECEKQTIQKKIVKVIRPSAMRNKFAQMSIHIDGNYVGSIKNNETVTFEVDARVAHSIQVSFSSNVEKVFQYSLGARQTAIREFANEIPIGPEEIVFSVSFTGLGFPQLQRE